MVKFYDENYKEVYLPGDSRLHYGSIPLELTISSIQMEKAGGKSKPVGRTASLRGAIIASDDIDMDMKMDNVMTFLRRLGEFYVAKANTPFKLLKVEVLDSYDIEPGNGVLTEFVVPLNVLKPFYKQSLHTTGTIGSEGMLFNNKWGYGMGTWFAENYWQYEFKGIPVNENILNTYNFRKRSSEYAVPILQGGLTKGTYTISFEYNVNSSPNGVTNFLLYAGSPAVYIELESYVEAGSDRIFGTFSITDAQSLREVTLYGGTSAAESLNNDISFNNVKIEKGSQATPFNIPGGSTSQKYTFFNAGNEEVKLIQQKESEITLTLYSIPPNNLIDIDDGSTTFKIWKDFKLGDVLKIKGDSVTLNGANVLGDTNFNFLTVKTGWNYWEVRGLKNADFKIDFRFLYD